MKYITSPHSYIVLLVFLMLRSCAAERGGVDVLSGQKAERLKAALEDVLAE